jgi:hypothetical protein
MGPAQSTNEKYRFGGCSLICSVGGWIPEYGLDLIKTPRFYFMRKAGEVLKLAHSA